MVVNYESAKADVEKWLEHKKLNERKRDEKKESIESLISYFEDGTLTLEEDYSITMKLNIPIGINGVVKELKFKPRLTVKDISLAKNKNAKSATDPEAFVMDRVVALTGQNRELLMNMDTIDHSVCQTIAVFFI